MEPEGSSPYPQQPAACPYPDSDRSSLCPPSNISHVHFNIFHLRLGLPSGLLPSGFPTKALYAPLLFPIKCRTSNRKNEVGRPQRPDLLWLPPNLPFNLYRNFFPRIKPTQRAVRHFPYIVPSLKMSGAKPLLPHMLLCRG
jgi:hypothetical protein